MGKNSLQRVATVTQATSSGSRRGGISGRRYLSVLLAEDNVLHQMIVTRLLEAQGHMVVVARDGHDALDAFDRTAFDIVLMDVQMPGMDGFETTAAIRQRELESGKRAPIIAITAEASSAGRARCLGAGMDAYIAKPFRSETLMDVIAELDRLREPAVDRYGFSRRRRPATRDHRRM